MCGITGILLFRPGSAPDERQQLARRISKMTATIKHRGPDGESLWQNAAGTCLLGHRRLAILDLSAAAAQPMHFSERFTLTFNGEIYNHVELRHELSLRGYSFTTRSDAEVLLAAYACFGEKCLEKIDGMFAFAIWDEEEKSLFAARDRFGEKPFYYSFCQEEFCFASEKKALWAGGLQRKINSPLLLNWLALGYAGTAADRTICFYEDVYSLPPAHFLRVNARDAGFSLTRYWDCDKQTIRPISEKEAIEQFNDYLHLSVERRLRMDVTVGSSLSGGLDSSTLAMTMKSLMPEKFTCYSARFPGFSRDESAFVSRLSGDGQLDTHFVEPNPEDFAREFDRLCYHQEEPFSSSSIYAQFSVYAAAAANGTRVLLDGQGADETAAGYPRYIPWYLQQLLRRRPAEFLKEKRAFRKSGFAFSWSWKNYPAAWAPTLVPGQLEKREAGKILSNKLIHPEFRRAYFDRQSLYKPLVLSLNDMLYFDTCQFELEELLRYADRNSMAHGLEVRLPFLQHEWVQFLFSLPAHFKLHKGWTKWISRKAMDPILPREICWRKGKVGFEPPQQAWLQTRPFTEKISAGRELLVREKILDAGILQKKIQPQDAHAAENMDWRCLLAAAFVGPDLFPK